MRGGERRTRILQHLHIQLEGQFCKKQVTGPCQRMVCVCLLLQYLIQSCECWGRRIVEDMCYECVCVFIYYCKGKILFRNGNLTLALTGWCRRLWARSGCGGSGWAPGWCGWSVVSLLWCCCGGAVCWRPAISLPTQSVTVGEWVDAWGCGGGRAAAWASSGRGLLQQACGFTSV
jgi:hypothetical protein